MFSYQHIFHTGNHADVLKHVVLVEVLQYVCQKETAVFYIDTHAGAGMYALDRNQAQKNREFESGIGRLWSKNSLPSQLDAYLHLIRQLNPDGILRQYPGSPYLADKILREQDRLRLFEWHPAEHKALAHCFSAPVRQKKLSPENKNRRGKRIMTERKDGFSALKGLLPPPLRRAVVLMDPSYENKSDYQLAVSSLKDAIRRFSSGVYLVWYPILSRMEAKRLPVQLKSLPVKEWLNVTLTVSRMASDGVGLFGSGLFLVNPPWKLKAWLEELMPHLSSILGQDEKAFYQIETGGQTSV